MDHRKANGDNHVPKPAIKKNPNKNYKNVVKETQLRRLNVWEKLPIFWDFERCRCEPEHCLGFWDDTCLPTTSFFTVSKLSWRENYTFLYMLMLMISNPSTLTLKLGVCRYPNDTNTTLEITLNYIFYFFKLLLLLMYWCPCEYQCFIKPM